MENKEHITEGQQVIETNAKGAPVKDVLWNSAQVETESHQIQDPGAGGEVILRHFFFKALPLPPNVPKPDKHQIVAQFKKLIEMTLFGDGYMIREDKPIEVHTLQKVKKISKTLYKKMLVENADFVILCLASPRRGVTVHDKAHIAL